MHLLKKDLALNYCKISNNPPPPPTSVNNKIEINLPVAVIIHLNPMYSQNP